MTSEKQQAEALKACPFCGGRAVPYLPNCDGEYLVECHNCCAAFVPFKTEGEAIKSWNTRTPSAEVTALIELVDEIIDNSGDDSFGQGQHSAAMQIKETLSSLNAIIDGEK